MAEYYKRYEPSTTLDVSTAAASGDLPDAARLRLRSVSCPACAGALRAEDGERLLQCDRCGSRYLAAAEDGFSRRYFPNQVERLQAVGKGTRFLLEHPGMPNDIKESAFVEAHPVYVPIWEVRAYVVGWEFGKRTRSRLTKMTGGDEEYPTMEVVTEGIQEGFLAERRHYQAAAELATLGIGRPHVTGRDFSLPYASGELERGAAVFGANRDHAEVVARARKAFLRPPSGTGSRGARLFVLKETTTLLYYPLWSLRYRYRGRLYEMTLDGRNGVVHSARGPADNDRRLALLLAMYAALAIAVALSVASLSADEIARQASFYTLLVTGALTGGAYWRFRLVREVEYHEPFSY
jgi:hypothetical protein